MKPISFWLDSPYSPRLALSEDIETDVVIVGGGLTGISAAYHSAQQGFKTVLVEKEIIANGPAGKNSGMVVDGLAIDFRDAVKQFGSAEAKELWLRTIEARELVLSLIKENKIDCDLEQTGSIYTCLSETENDLLREEMSARKQAGIDCGYIEEGQQLKGSNFKDAIFNPNDFIINPIKFIRGLAKAAEEKGAIIYENTPALSFDGNTVTTPNGIIKAKKVIVAIERNSPSLSKDVAFQWGHQGVVTEPLSDAEIKELDWKIGGALWNMGEDYISLRFIGKRLFFSSIIKVDLPKDDWGKSREEIIERFISYMSVLKKIKLKVSHQWTRRDILYSLATEFSGVFFSKISVNYSNGTLKVHANYFNTKTATIVAVFDPSG